MNKKIIEITNLTITYENENILNNINLDIYENEIVTLLGHSGCGKTSLLKAVGGFIHPKSGSIKIDGNEVINLPANKRPVNTVFQNYALFPHLNVFENVAFGLRVKKIENSIINKKVNEMLSLVKMKSYKNKKISELSGGQQQRIAIIRALINEPKVLLLDEPLSALDADLKNNMQYELKEINRKLKTTFIYVTHDQEEALNISNRIIVINDGLIMQNDTPESIYYKPSNIFVANFIGNSNIIDATVLENNNLKINNNIINYACHIDPNTQIKIIIKPEHIILDKTEHLSEQIITIDKAIVEFCSFKGTFYKVILKSINNKHKYVANSMFFIKEKENVYVKINTKSMHIITSENY